VVASADATPGQAGCLRAEGARDHLTKPLDIRRLVEVVVAALSPATAGPAG
jgi:CheY-like chemotaxis protein